MADDSFLCLALALKVTRRFYFFFYISNQQNKGHLSGVKKTENQKNEDFSGDIYRGLSRKL